MTLVDLVILAAATWYCSEMVTGKAGPFNIFGWLRAHLPLGGLTTCPYCAAPYISVAMLLIYYLLLPEIVWVFAVAGVALALRFYVDERYQQASPGS